MDRRVFTPFGARRSLVRVRPLAEGLRRLWRELEQRRPPQIRGDQPVDPVYFAGLSRLREILARLQEAGVRVRDPRSARIEFPARRLGRPVWLCWHPDQPTVGSWCDPGDGSPPRPIDEDGPWDSH